MRVTRLECRDYRGFASADIDLDERMTVLVGVNGSGKSSILDAIHLLLSQYSARLVATSASASRLKATDVRLGTGGTTLRLRAEDHRVGSIAWTLKKQGSRERVLRPTGSELRGLNSFAKFVADQASGDTDYLRGETVPVYYDQSRSILNIPKRRRAVVDDSPKATFAESLGGWGIDFRRFTFWFQDRESDELRRQRRDRSYVDRQLAAVRQAIQSGTGFKEPYFSVDVPRGITLTKGKARLHVSQLSTGEQVFMALAGDLARRLACVGSLETNPLEGKAIVLIDEVELHLHPRWQRRIVSWLIETFPQCQFIVTTHSPQVVSDVHARHVRILSDFPSGTRVFYPDATFGRDSNHILLSLFDVDERRPATKRLIERVDDAITRDDLARAEALIARLRQQIEGPSPEVTVLEARLERQARSRG